MPTDSKRPRWGLRTLLFLGLALISMLASELQGTYTLLTLAGLAAGLGGATYSTVRGLLILKDS
jgi:hypothetical protein